MGPYETPQGVGTSVPSITPARWHVPYIQAVLTGRVSSEGSKQSFSFSSISGHRLLGSRHKKTVFMGGLLLFAV